MGESTFLGADAYEDAVVDVATDEGPVTLGREGIVAGHRWQPAAPAYIVTAYNPGRALTLAENEAAQKRLVDYLTSEGLEWLPAVGRSRDSRHQEPSVVLEDIDESAARRIASEFGQDAIFRWTEGALTVVSCARLD